MKNTSELRIHETDGVEPKVGEATVLKIHSHPNWRDRVIIETPDGKKYTVIARGLEKAITNNTNV